MPREKKKILKVSENNEHLYDVFSNDFYLELGTIEHEPLTRLLNRQLVDFKDLVFYDIIKNGIGSMQCSSDELNYKIPLMYFNNIVSKNKSYQLVLTYGLILRRKGYKEYFTPIILIPVNMYFENDTILFQMINKAIVNPYIKVEHKESVEDMINFEKLDSIYNMDKYILTFLKNHTSSIRLENYLTLMHVKQPEIELNKKRFKYETSIGSRLIEKYSVDDEGDIYPITPIDRAQRNAVSIATSGNSFVLTGHEGTGKTTTLINIAADFIKNGKRVLYVSNNDNTLQKVYDTFASCDLDPYLSVLTNSFDKINEKGNELKKTQIFDIFLKQEINEKYKNIDKLMDYFAVKIQNYLMIEIMNELILTPKPKELFSEKIMKNVDNLYKHEIEVVINTLSRLEKLMEKMPVFTESNFLNIPVSHNIDDPSQIISLLEEIYDKFCVLNEEKDILEKKYGFSNIANFALFKNIIKDYFSLNKKNIPLSWYKYYNESEEELINQFFNYKRARELYVNLKEETSLYNHLFDLYHKKYDLEDTKFDIERAISEITDKYFDINDERINSLLQDYVKIENELSKAIAYCRDLENYYNKLKHLLDFSTDLKETKVIEEILEYIFVLDKGYFAKVWCDYDKRENVYKRMFSIEQTLDKYEESIKVYNKYFDSINNIDKYLKLLIKKNKVENKKYHGILISELLSHVQFVKLNHDNIHQLKKEYKELTYKDYEYKVSISSIFKEFMEKHDQISDKKTRIEIENAFQSLNEENIKMLVSCAKDLKKALLNVSVSYDLFSSYGLIDGASNAVEKIAQIKSIIKYIKNVFKWQMKLHRVIKERKDNIFIDSYIELRDHINNLDNLYNKINNDQEYKYLYSTLFDGENTNVEDIEKLLNEFGLYLSIFNNPISLVNSFENNIIDELAIHLKTSSGIIEEINILFQNYSKIFKGNINEYSYDDFKKRINHFKLLKDSQEELKVYLAITDEMKILLKYNLFNLNNYIIYHNHELFSDRFKYTFFNNLYKKFIIENPDFIDHKNHEELLDNIMFLEKDLIDSNIEVIKLSNKIYKTGKAPHLNYNSFIEKNGNSKLLFLSDTRIANIFLDINLFDLVIIDDAHMLSANEYYKVVNAKQLVIGGNQQKVSELSDNLISRMRLTSVVRLKYRYSKTPLRLLKQYDDITGRFFSPINSNKGISVSTENFNSIVLKRFRKDNNCKINFFTTSYSKMHELFQNVSNVLYDIGYSVNSISLFFKNNLNICDLYLGNLIEADYNILDLESYYDNQNDIEIQNMINSLLACKKELIIYDSKNHLNDENETKLISNIKNIINYKLPEPNLIENTIIEKIANSLEKYRIKTIGAYYPLHLVIEEDNHYYGILILENPSNTEFTILNEYREFKSNDLPIIVRWLSDLVDDYDGVIKGIVKEIRS